MNGQSSHASCGGCGSSKKVYTPPVTRTPFALLSLTTGVSLFPSKTTRKSCCTACEEGDAPCGCGACGNHPQSPGDVFTLAPPMKVRWREQDDWDLPTRFVLSRAGSPSAVGLRSAFKPVLAQPKFPPPRPRKTAKAPPPPGVPFGISAGGKTGVAKRKGPQIIRRNIDRELTLGDAMAWVRGVGDQSKVVDFSLLVETTRLAAADIYGWLGRVIVSNYQPEPETALEVGQFGQVAAPPPTQHPCDQTSNGLGHPVSPADPNNQLTRGRHLLIPFANVVGFVWAAAPGATRECSGSFATGILIGRDKFLTCAHAPAARILETHRPRGGTYPVPHPVAGASTTTAVSDQEPRAIGVLFDFFHTGANGAAIAVNANYQAASARIRSLDEFGANRMFGNLDYAILTLGSIPLVAPAVGTLQPRGFARMRGWNMTDSQRVYCLSHPSGAPLRAFGSDIQYPDTSCLDVDPSGRIAEGQVRAGGGSCMEAPLDMRPGASGAAWLDSDGCVRGVNQGQSRQADLDRVWPGIVDGQALDFDNIAVRLHSVMRHSPMIRRELARQAPEAFGVPFFYQRTSQHILFRGHHLSGASLMHLYRPNTDLDWRLRDLGALIGAPLPDGSPAATWWDEERSRVNFLYRTDDGGLIRLAGNPHGAIDSNGRGGDWGFQRFTVGFREWRDTTWLSTTGWRSRDANTQHVVAVGRRGDGRRFLAEFWRSEGRDRFQTRDLSQLLRLAQPTGALEGLTSWYAGDDYSHLAFIDTFGSVHHVWHNGHGWRDSERIQDGGAHGRITSHYYSGAQRVVFQVGGSLRHAYWAGGRISPQIRILEEEMDNLPPPRQPNAECTLCGSDRTTLWYISARNRLVAIRLRTMEFVEYPTPTPILGPNGLQHISATQSDAMDRAVGVGADGQVYYWLGDGGEGTSALSLQARTGWPLGWQYSPLSGRLP